MSTELLGESRAMRAVGYSVDAVLECARGIAALWVFMFHIGPMFAPWPLLQTFAKYGHQGVPLFFVISGYCMMAAADNTFRSQRPPTTFLKRRLLRIFPPFWISVLAVMAAPYLIEAISALKTGSMAVLSPTWLTYSWVDWIKVLTLIKVLDNSAGDLQATFSPINAVYWSLAIEVQFYLVMYVSLFFKSRWKKTLIAVTLMSILANLSPMLANGGWFMNYWPAFFVGLVLREAHQRGLTPAAAFGRNELEVSLLAVACMLAGLLVVIFAAPCATPFACSTVPNLTFTLAAVLAALLLWTFGGVEHVLRHKVAGRRGRYMKAWMLLPLAWLGQSSYSLYLLHGKLYQLPAMFVRQVVPPTSLLFPLLIISTTAVLCYMFYLLAEKPFHSLAQNVDRPITVSAASLAAQARP